ncbi:hypothetical protein KY363_03535 [Candidatus Woesearchaeota archaeon]|nr:hypothetical protein [Candidatus Woesearchaeota archaeon]
MDFLDNRVVEDVVRDVKYRLQLLPPNGASVHRLGNCLCALDGMLFKYVGGIEPSGETFAQLRQRAPEHYERRVDKLEEIRSHFKVYF